jgi:hypothetical protein
MHARIEHVMQVLGGKCVNVMQVRDLEDPASVFEQMVEILCSMTRVGLVHCDFNEFNVILCDDGRLIAIDFPQMVSVSHANAKMLFERDLHSTIRFFTQKLKYNLETDGVPCWEDLLQEVDAKSAVDVELHASGFNNVAQDSIGPHRKQQQDDCSGAESDGHSDARSESCQQESKIPVAVTGSDGEAPRRCQGVTNDSTPCSEDGLADGDVGKGEGAGQCCTSDVDGDAGREDTCCSDSSDVAQFHELREVQSSEVISEDQV